MMINSKNDLTAKEIVQGIMREKYAHKDDVLYVLLSEEAYNILLTSGLLNYKADKNSPFNKLPIHRRMSVCGMHAVLVKEQNEPFVLIHAKDCPIEYLPVIIG